MRVHRTWATLIVASDGTSSSTRTLPGVSDALSSVGLGMLVPASSSNLLGQHTVRMSPVSTAELNSDGHRYCIASHTSPLLVPVLLNNTNPSVVRYSLTPLNGSEQHIEYFDVSPRDLRLAELSRGNSHRNGAPSPSTAEEDEYDDEEATEEKGPTLQKTQTVAYIPITRPGVLRLERVIHSNSVDARLAYPTSLVIAPCPSAAFVANKDSAHSFIRCLGSHEDIRTDIDISGVPPLSLRYSRHHKHIVEHFDVEGIDGHRQIRQRSHAPQTVRTPLDLAVGAAGTHFYILESVTDGLGNQVLLQESPSALIKSEMDHPGHLAKEKPPFARSVHVLSRPQLSFEGCNPSSPARLLKGQEATLTLRATDVDVQDWPLQATVSFEPLVVEDGKGASISSQAWTKTLQIDGRISRFQASSAGLYTLHSGQGKNCEAEVLNPDSCRVVELPRPSADIEWKRIHEWSVAT
jgi:nucleoporin POM152